MFAVIGRSPVPSAEGIKSFRRLLARAPVSTKNVHEIFLVVGCWVSLLLDMHTDLF